MRKNNFISTCIKISVLLILITASKLSFSQACNPKWDRTQSSNCENSPIQFNANSPGKNTYYWDYGDNSNTGTGTGPNFRDPVHPYAKAGTYVVTYTFSTSGSGVCTDTIMITIKESPVVKVRPLHNKNQCFAGNYYCFVDSTRAAKGSKLLSLKYLFSDGALYTILDPKGNGQDTICHSVIDPNGGYFDLTIEAEDYNGCVTKVKYDTFIRVFPKIGVNFTSNAPNACIQSIATIKNLTPSYTPLSMIQSFVWNFGFPGSPNNIIAGNASTNSQWWMGPTGNGVITHLYNVAGMPSGTYVFNAKLVVTTVHGCVDSFTFKGSATISILNLVIGAVPDSTCASSPTIKFTLYNKSTMTVPSVGSFLWNFGHPPSGNLNFNNTSLVGAPHNYPVGPWMTSITVKAGPCTSTVFDTILVIGPSSTIEVPFNRVPEDEKYQCVIRDSVHFPNNSSFYHVDDVPVFEDSSAVYRYYTLLSFNKVGYYELPLIQDTIGPYGTYQGRATTKTRFYLEKDTLESFNQSLLAPDSIYYIVNGKYIKKPIINPIISGKDTLVIRKEKQYAFRYPGNQTAIPSIFPPATQRHKEHALRLWTFGDNYAPKCTTDTKKNKNVGLNCNFSMDEKPVHWYTPWDQIYKYYRNGQFYGAPAEKTVLCKGGRFCYKIRYYPQQSFVIPDDTLIIVPRDSTVTYGGVTITPSTPEKMTGSFRIKKVPSFMAGLGTYIPTLSDEAWTFKTDDTVSVKDIVLGIHTPLGAGTHNLVRMQDQFRLNPEFVWRTFSLSSSRGVSYDELKWLHSEPSHKPFLIYDRSDFIPGSGNFTDDVNEITRFYLEKDTLETFTQSYDAADSIYFFVSGVKVKKAISNPIVSGNDVLTINKYHSPADTAYSIIQVKITAGRTITAQPTTICVDTIMKDPVSGLLRDTFIQRSRIFIDSAFHRQNFYTKTAQCNTVGLYHIDTVHSMRCESVNQISLALLPPSAKGLEFKGIKCYAPPSPPYGLEFDVGKTKPGCTQRLLKFNFDSASGKNNWVSHGGFLAPPLPGSAPWHLGYQLSGAYPTTFAKPYGAGEIRDRNPGWVTVGVIIGNGRLINGVPECIDTFWYHNHFRYLYLDSRFDVIAPEKDKKTVCVGDTITFRLIDPIMDSITQLVWNWNDDEGSYYEERSFYYKPYPGPSSTRNDKGMPWKKGDKWLYNYVVRLNYDGFSYQTLDTIVTGVIRKWSIGVDVSRAGEALKRAFEALGLVMSEIPAADIPLFFGDGTGTGCIDTTGLGSLISYGVAPYRDALTYSRHGADDVILKGKNGSDSIYSLDWYRYTDFTKTDSTIISQSLHWRSKSQTGFDTLKQANPNRYSGMKVTPGVYRHVYKKANRYFPTFQLRNTEGCFGPRNKEVDVGFYWNWTYSDTVVCHGTDIVIKDSIRYFAYEDPFIWLDPFAYWKDPTRFQRQQELKRIDFNEHDDSLLANKFAVRGLGIPPFKWHYDDPGIYTIRIAMKDSTTTLRDNSQWVKNGDKGCVDTARQKVYVTGVKAGFKALNAGVLGCNNIISFLDTSRVIDPCMIVKNIKCDEIVEYTWDFGDGKKQSKLKNPSHDFTQNGTFIVKLNVKTRLGCEDNASFVIKIFGPRPLFAAVTDTVICTGDSVIFENLSLDTIGPNAQWVWDFGDGGTGSDSTKAKVGHRYNKAGIYHVFLTMFDVIPGTNIRCSKTYPDKDTDVVVKIEHIVIVKPKMPANFTIAPNDTICPETRVTLNSESDPTYKRFIWIFGDGDIITTDPDPFTSHTYTKVGNYDVTLIPDYDLPIGEFHKCLDTVKKKIVVIDVKADFDIIDKDAPKFCFTNKSVGASSYEWIFFEKNGPNGGSVDVDPCYTFRDTGCFDVTLIAKNYIGCIDSITKQVCYTFVSKIIPYNVFTPEPKDGINDVFKVNAEGLDNFDIIIYNRWGEVVFESTDQNFAWDGTVKNKGKVDCPEGTYFYIMNYKIKNKEQNDGQDKPISGTVTLIRGKK